MLPQQYCLRWKYHHSNLQTMFSQLLDRGCFCDVTLACEGQLIRAHRVVLCACSTFFDTVLTNYASERDPIIIMKDVTFADVKSLIEFMYKGEINVEHANLASLLKTADDLKIKGLAEVSWRDDEEVAHAGSSGAPPPVHDPDAFPTHSPHRLHDAYGAVSSGGAAVAQDMRTSPNGESGPGVDRRVVSPPSVQSNKFQPPPRQPLQPPKPSHSVTIAAAASSADQYYGPKRKRGRPPLDDAYDVFNVRKLAHYAGHLESQPFLDAGRLHGAPHPTSAYQQHIHQQQRRQRQKHDKQVTDSDEADDNQTDPEWITSNLEVNVGECDAGAAMAHTEADSNECRTEQHSEQNKAQPKDTEMMNLTTSPSRDRECTPIETKAGNEKLQPAKVEHRFKKRSVLEKAKERQRESKEREREKEKEREREREKERELEQEKAKEKDRELGQEKEKEDKYKDEEKRPEQGEEHAAVLLPQTVEDIENGQKPASSAATTSDNTITTTIPSPSAVSCSPVELPTTSTQTKLLSTAPAHSHALALSHSHVHAHPQPLAHAHIPPAHSHAHVHFAKYAAAGAEGSAGATGGAGGGYLVNEHGMLMTHDFPPHSAAAAAVMGTAPNGDHDFGDIKMEDYDVADLRLTSEEMSEWQDVIKMDDYLSKGRRPQFWEEPFTRRVLDAIKNKRLEMKKAARILGVSYGTLYGRYREVYGCLKHPYSSAMRPSQSSQLAAVQPRFDIVWPSPKRDPGLQPSPLEIGKIRPKDLCELWARPQI